MTLYNYFDIIFGRTKTPTPDTKYLNLQNLYPYTYWKSYMDTIKILRAQGMMFETMLNAANGKIHMKEIKEDVAKLANETMESLDKDIDECKRSIRMNVFTPFNPIGDKIEELGQLQKCYNLALDMLILVRNTDDELEKSEAKEFGEKLNEIKNNIQKLRNKIAEKQKK